MLEFTPTNDRALRERLSGETLGRAPETEVAYVLYDNGTAVGYAEILISPEEARILAVGITPERRGEGLGDFFTRSLLLFLSGVSRRLTAYGDGYFSRFGFKLKNGKMEILSEALTFPKKCK